MGKKRWTKEEEELLRREYRALGAGAIGERIGRSTDAVLRRAYVVGVTRKIGGPHRKRRQMARIAAYAERTSYGRAAMWFGLTRGTVAGVVRDVRAGGAVQ